MDKDNQKLADFYRPYHPAVRRLIKLTIDNAHKNNKKVAISGQLACDTAATVHLLTYRADELIMIPSNLLKIKAIVRETNQTDINNILNLYKNNRYLW